MAKEISPLRPFMRSNSRKSLTESSEGSSLTMQEPPVVSSTTPQRQPLRPIPESKQNPLIPTQAGQSLPDSAATTGTPKCKSDQATPRAKAKFTPGENEKYRHWKNSGGSINRNLVKGTPEKNTISNSRGKNRWHTHRSSIGLSGSRTSPAQVTVDTASDLSTPPRGSAENTHVSTEHGYQNVSKVQTLEASLEQAEGKISEMARAVGAFEVAKLEPESESERDSLMIELEELRASSHRQKSRINEAEAKVAALESLFQQYRISEETWKFEILQLVEKLKEVESMSSSVDQSAQGEALECSNLSASDEVPEAHIERLKSQVDNLKRKVSDKDGSILSAKKEMEVAVANLKEAEIEIDKLQGEKDTLKKTCDENANTILTLTTSLSRAEEEISRKQLKVDAFEKEMLRVGEFMDEWEVKMLDAERAWKGEKEELMKEIDSAKLEAREKGLEAAVLNQKFQETQVTLMEVESLVNLLVIANETGKHTAHDLRLQRDELRQYKEVWVQERDRLLAAVNCLRVELDGRDQQVSLSCEEIAVEFSEIFSILISAQEEIVLMRSKHEEEMQSLSDEMKNIRNHLLQGIPVWQKLEVDTLHPSSEQQRRNVREVEVENSFLSEQLDATEATVQPEFSKTDSFLILLEEYFLEQENEAVLVRKKLMDFEFKIQDSNQIIAQLSSEKNTAQERLSELETRMANTVANVQHLMEELEDLELKLFERLGEGASEAQVGQLKTEVDELKSRLHYLEYSLTLAETEMDDHLESSQFQR